MEHFYIRTAKISCHELILSYLAPKITQNLKEIDVGLLLPYKPLNLNLKDVVKILYVTLFLFDKKTTISPFFFCSLAAQTQLILYLSDDASINSVLAMVSRF